MQTGFQGGAPLPRVTSERHPSIVGALGNRWVPAAVPVIEEREPMGVHRWALTPKCLGVDGPEHQDRVQKMLSEQHPWGAAFREDAHGRLQGEGGAHSGSVPEEKRVGRGLSVSDGPVRPFDRIMKIKAMGWGLSSGGTELVHLAQTDHTWNPSTEEVGARGSEVQSHPLLHSILVTFLLR